MNRIFRKLWHPELLLPVVALFLLFQNCSGYTAAFNSSNSSSASGSPSGSSPGNSVAAVTKSVAGMEWQPMTIQLTTTQTLTAKSLPEGAIFSASTNSVLWIPKVGQAGSYGVDFYDSSNNNQLHLAITISAISQMIIAKGAIDSTTDGDVGFVFVHGMGSIDYCANAAALTAYWGGSPQIITRTSPVTLGCYDSAQAVETVAATVAQEIVSANCGRFQRCIIVTHSMGGLVTEFILQHARASVSTDTEPNLFAQSALYAQAKAKILSVIAIASAAGGADTATVLESPTQTAQQASAAALANQLNLNTAAVKSLVVARASNVLAPMTVDPNVPVYMVPGYTLLTSGQAGITTSGAFLNAVPLTVYDSNTEYAALDPILTTGSRSDGLVEFRSGCGIASDDPGDGPGYTQPLSAHFSYCYQSTKKPNHFVWFITSMNHTLSPTPWENCANTTNPCQTWEPNSAQATFVENTSLTGVSAVAEIRAKLDSNRSAIPSSAVVSITLR